MGFHLHTHLLCQHPPAIFQIFQVVKNAILNANVPNVYTEINCLATFINTMEGVNVQADNIKQPLQLNIVIKQNMLKKHLMNFMLLLIVLVRSL